MHIQTLKNLIAFLSLTAANWNDGVGAGEDPLKIAECLADSANAAEVPFSGVIEMTPDDIKPFDQDPDPIQVIKACMVLIVVMRDWPEFYDNIAWHILDCLRDAAIKRLPGFGEVAWIPPAR